MLTELVFFYLTSLALMFRPFSEDAIDAIQKLSHRVHSNQILLMHALVSLKEFQKSSNRAFTYLPLLRMASYTVSLTHESLTWYFLYHSHHNDGKYVNNP